MRTARPVVLDTGPMRSDRVERPVVIGHRGASGYRPEHTLGAYALAARLGADFIEPDLVSTADGVLVARHENDISRTTDVAGHPEFADRRTTRVVDGRRVEGWFTEDFTLAELRTLRAVERMPALRPGNTVHDGREPVPTLEEVLGLRRQLSAELGREIGVYPETKHPSHFAARGLSLAEPLLAALRADDLDRAGAPVFVQSFEAGILHRLRHELGARAPQVLLLPAGTDPGVLTPPALARLVGTVEGIGPAKDLVLPRDPDGALGLPSTLVADAHAAGLLVHPWTFRAENRFLPACHRLGADPASPGLAVEELRAFLDLGVDGVFADQPDLAVTARDGGAVTARAGGQASPPSFPLAPALTSRSR